MTHAVKNRGVASIEWIRMASLPPKDFANESLFALYAESGLSCIPIAIDGTKRPLGAWKEFQERLPIRSDILKWYREFGFNIGIAIITGAVSAGLEAIDFDDGSLFDPWFRTVESIACRLPIVSTPSFGWHVFYRCEEVCGSEKIAMDPGREKSTLIETRGQGGYVLAVGCPGECHPSGRPYVQELGPVLPEVPFITIDERRELWRAARAFDKRPLHQDAVEHRLKQLRREARPVKPLAINGNIPPWTDFDDRGEWSMILESAGWYSRDGIHWRRPGKNDDGFSAKVNIAKNGQEVLTVFSSNAGPLSPTKGEKSWGKSDAFALLLHGGNLPKSARALWTMGYGGRKR